MNTATQILLVDDEVAIVQVLSEMLRLEGYEVWEATTGQQALQLARERRPHLVLLDVLLPDLSGIEVCRQIKAEAALADIFVVLLSGKATSAPELVEGLAAGADDYMTKPVVPSEFLERMRTLLRLRQTTAALRASEQRYRQLVEILPDAVGLIDLEGRLRMVNRQAAAMLGYESEAELVEKSVFALTRPADHDRLRADLAATSRGGSLRNLEYEVIKKGGDALVAQVNTAVSADKRGRPAGFVVLVRDITRQKREEEALQRNLRHLDNNARFLRSLMDAIPTPVFYKDAAGRYLGCNKAFEQFLGMPEAEIVGKTVYEVAPKDLADVYHEADKTLLEKPGVQTYETLLRHADGTRRHVIFSKATFHDAEGKVAGLVGATLDITERKRAEEQARLLADAVQSARDLICIADEENRLIFVNRAFLEAYGYREGEILGKTPDMLISANNPPGIIEHILKETLAGGWRGEILDRRKDGSEFPVSLVTSPIKSSDGRIVGLIGVARDISERKAAERQSAAFSHLGHRLSAAGTQEQAAAAILDIASELFGWDAGYVHLYSQADDRIVPVLTVDTKEGQRMPVPRVSFTLDPSPLMRRVMNQGALRLDRAGGASPGMDLVPFGDRARPSACMMYVPIQSSGTALGILSIQSYTPQNYSEADLKLLQTLANYCGDTLRRIEGREALRKAEAKYRNIFENSTEGIFQTTPEGRHLSANPALARMLGYETPEEMMSSVTDLARQVYVVPERRRELKLLIEKEGSVRGFEAELYRKDGSKVWVSINARVGRDASGAVLYYEGINSDITETKRMQNLLQVQRDFGTFLGSINDMTAAAERLLRNALQNGGVDCGAVYLVDPKTGTLDLVAHEGLSAGFAERASHFARAALQERPDARGRGIDWSEGGLLAHLLKALTRERLRAKEIIPLQYGAQVVAVLLVGSHVCGEIPGQSCQVIDALAAQAGGALARIRAEQASQSSQQLLAKTLHSMRAAVFILDVDATSIQECNPAATRMFGYDREELIGKSPFLLHLEEAAANQFREHLRSATDPGKLLSEFEFRTRRKDGTPLPTEQTLTPIRNEAGRVVNWVNVIRDLTARKRAEEELRQLPRRIIEAQETERLRVARELHDGVNQVLASAKMRLHRVRETMAAASPAASQILERCTGLLAQALEENRRIAHNLRPADLDQLGLAVACRNLCEDFQARTNLKLKSRITRFNGRWLPAVELNLFRIAQEALSNVEKHARAKTVRLRLALQGNCLVLKIQDDGRGFDQQARRRTAKRNRQPPGIGLTDMSERAASLGAAFKVKSSLGQGTTVSVRVPGAQTT